VARIPWKVGALLALLPLVFTGKAFLRGDLYGPADLYYGQDPWKRIAAESGVTEIHNPILSDLAFANLPWREAVREAAVNGRLPLWNRFVLAGGPLAASAQAGLLHPATLLGIFLPLPLSWTFSCAFTIFLALLSGYLFFREFCRSEVAAATGAVAWGFSTYVLFWDGWAVGPSVVVFPLVLLGLRRLAREGARAVGLTSAAILLSFFGGHPETFFHSMAAAGVYFLWELAARENRRRLGRAVGGAIGAGLVAFALAAPLLFPLLEALPISAEYAERRAMLDRGAADQSVSAAEAARRLLPAVLPFAHGIYGKSPVQEWRQDGSGMPLGYAGAVLFPLAAVGLFAARRPTSRRGRGIFLGLVLAGLAYGSSAPGLLDTTSRLPGFELALNYRLVFLAPLGLAGLAALGADEIARRDSGRPLAAGSGAVLLVLLLAFLLASGVFRERGLPDNFVRESFAYEIAPLALLLAGALLARAHGRGLAAAALLLLVAQRGLEMRGTYPTLSAASLTPALPTLGVLPRGGDPYRVVATEDVFRPNGAALYGLEDVRGYESLVLARFAETYPLWCREQFASFNRVEDLTRPFLSFVNVRYAIANPDIPAPSGWVAIARGREMALFENIRPLPRAFVPRRVRMQPDPRKRLAEMGHATDFGERAWIDADAAQDVGNGAARVTVRAIGSDLLVTADVAGRALVATSMPDWPGWRAEGNGRDVPLVTVNHAFVGFWLSPGRHAVRLAYLPRSFSIGVWVAGASLAVLTLLGVLARRRARAL